MIKFNYATLLKEEKIKYNIHLLVKKTTRVTLVCDSNHIIIFSCLPTR